MKRKYKPRTRPRPKTRHAKTLQRDPAVAAYLRIGKKPTEACRLAGYPESVVRSSAKQIAESEAVQKLIAQQNNQLIETGRGIDVQDLGSIAKVRVREGLSKFKANAKEGKLLLGFARTGMESAGMLGGPSELHLHQHNFPPQVCKMLAEMAAKILVRDYNKTPEQAIEMAQGDSSLVLDVEAIRPKLVEQLPAETASPATEATQPIDQLTVDTSDFEREQMERFTADYQRKHGMFPRRRTA